MDILEFIEEWYTKHCNGDWEHTYGINIETIDNPGWSVNIDLKNTYLEIIGFQTIIKEFDDLNWYHCKVEDNIFKGRGGAKNLRDILNVFCSWAEKMPVKSL